MNDETSASTTTIKVIVRHSKSCRKKHPELTQDSKNCDCRKSLYIYENGKDTIVSARTRIWDEAEKQAQMEREKRNPVFQRVKELEAKLAVKKAEEAAPVVKDMSITDATARWLKTYRAVKSGTEKAHGKAARRIVAWAKVKGIETVRQVTFDQLDEWQCEWDVKADLKFNRIGNAAQIQFQLYLKCFFLYMYRLGYVASDPAAELRPIKRHKDVTLPLTDDQVTQLFEAVVPCCKQHQGDLRYFSAELEIVLLIQLWTGLRIGDVVALKRSSLVGNRLSLITQKTGTPINGRLLPDVIVQKLATLSADRPHFRKEYFFWKTGVTTEESLSGTWELYIARLNRFVNFVDEMGKPMHFHSHILRDTFAVRHLLNGTSLEEVSRLLTHSSVVVTERHYAPWVRARCELLELRSIAMMRAKGMVVTTDDPLLSHLNSDSGSIAVPQLVEGFPTNGAELWSGNLGTAESGNYQM